MVYTFLGPVGSKANTRGPALAVVLPSVLLAVLLGLLQGCGQQQAPELQPTRLDAQGGNSGQGSAAVSAVKETPPQQKPEPAPTDSVLMVVMDLHAAPLSCSCVPGLAQRRYDVLAQALGTVLGQPVRVAYGESVMRALAKTPADQPHLIIGQRSLALADAQHLGLGAHLIAALRDQAGSLTRQGAVLVRQEAAITSLEDLAGKTVCLGPVADQQTHQAAQVHFTLACPEATLQAKNSIDEGLFAVLDERADAVVVEQDGLRLYEGCGKVGKGVLRAVASVKPVSGVQVFATDAVSADRRLAIQTALVAAGKHALVQKALETTGLVAMTDKDRPVPAGEREIATID